MEMMDVEDLFGGDSRPASRLDSDHDDRENHSPDEEEADRDDEAPRLDLDQGDDDAATPSETQKAQLELEAGKKKRIIRNPQPKLDPDRICGNRGVKVLEEIFKDFKPKGKGHEYDDLDIVMKKMEHWAHRLYPKLPFDNVMERISEVGKKPMVKTHVRKLRLGMISATSAREEEMMDMVDREQEEDTAKRYENDFPDDDDDLFEKLVREADERQLKENEEAARSPSPLLTNISSPPPSPSIIEEAADLI